MGTYTPPPPAPTSAPASDVLREAYLANSRMRMGSDITRMSAAALMLGLLGSLITWGHQSALFDLAHSSTRAVKPGIGYILGPILIMAILPAVSGRMQPIAIKRGYQKRLAIALALWVVGLLVLIGGLASLRSDETIQAGAYFAGGLLLVGLFSTLAMWPAGRPVVEVDSAGRVQEGGPVQAPPVQAPVQAQVHAPVSAAPVSTAAGNGTQSAAAETEPTPRAPAPSVGASLAGGAIPAVGGAASTKKRTVRDFAVGDNVDVWEITGAWAQRHGYQVVGQSPDGQRRVYRKGEGFMTGFRMLDLSMTGERAHLEAWVGALGLARALSLFILPAEIRIDSGGMKAVLPRKMGRTEVNELLEALGQPPIV